MITGELKTRIDAVWNDFWSGGISNPLEVMEQLTLLLFINGLDEAQTKAERKANRTGNPIENLIFGDGDFVPEGAARGRPFSDLRWDQFKHFAPADMYDVVSRYVFPFIQQRSVGTTHGQHMQGARFTIPTPALLQKAVDGLAPEGPDDLFSKADLDRLFASLQALADNASA